MVLEEECLKIGMLPLDDAVVVELQPAPITSSEMLDNTRILTAQKESTRKAFPNWRGGTWRNS